jgi:hypothetical protein
LTLFLAVLGVSALFTAACKQPTDDITSSETITDADDLAEYLTNASGGASADNPIPVLIELQLTAENWNAILSAIDTVGKFISLDLAACSMTSTEFNPDKTISTGKNKIVHITLPNAATSIAAGPYPNTTFNHFTSLKTAAGANITNIGGAAFYRIWSLTSISFPAAVNIGDMAFYNSSALQSANLPPVITLDVYAFYGARLQSIDLSAATSIGSYALGNCALQSVTFPAEVSLGTNPFVGCTSLVSFTLTGSGSLSAIENGKALVRNNTELVAYPAASGAIELTGIITVKNAAFEGSDALQSASLPNATSIETRAFIWCDALQSVYLPEAVTIGNEAFRECGVLQSLSLPKTTTFGSGATDRCRVLESLYLPVVTSFGGSLTFYYTGTANFTITMGAIAPNLETDNFMDTSSALTITVKVPAGATGYGTVPAVYTGSDNTSNWGNGFRGGGWNGSTMTTTTVDNN